MPYGKELILDLHDCDVSTFNRKSIKMFFEELCSRIDMNPEKLCWWDDYGLPPEECQTDPHTTGTSAVQFILTSNITIHTLDKLKCVYLNIFTCKDFNPLVAIKLAAEWFDGAIVATHFIDRT